MKLIDDEKHTVDYTNEDPMGPAKGVVNGFIISVILWIVIVLVILG